MLIIQDGKDNLILLLTKQLENFFPISDEEKNQIKDNLETSLKRIETCFSKINNKYYSDAEGNSIFSPYHSGQYGIFLYYLSNTLYKNIGSGLADKVYYLNKIMNAYDCFYAIELPNIFFCDHPVGTVLGRAEYSDYFAFSQNCTVGNNKGFYPKLGSHVTMLANSMVIGKSHIGNNVVFSANSYVKDQDVPDNTIVFGMSPNLIFQKNSIVNASFKKEE